MADVLKLYAMQIKIVFRAMLSSFSFGGKSKKPIRVVAVAFLFLFLLVQFIGMYTFICKKIFDVVKSFNHPEILIILVFVASQVITVIYGLFNILGTMFFAKDSEFLATLPIAQWKVFSSKFLLVYTNEMLLTFFMTLPPIIIFGLGMNLGVLYYIKALLVIFLLPLIPLAIASFLSFLMMGAVSRTKRRDTISIVLGLMFVVGIVIGQNILTNQLASPDFNENLSRLMQKSGYFIDLIGRFFPPSIWAGKAVALQQGSVLNLIYFFAVSAVGFALVVLVASKIYNRGALAHLESAKRETKKLNITYKTGPPLVAIYKRELKLLLRTAVYAMNVLVGVVLGPVLVLMMSVRGTNAIPFSDMLQDFLQGQYSIYVIYGLALAGLFFSAINPCAATVVSREGKTLWITKTIPVPYTVQVKAKLLASVTIGMLGVMVTIITAAVAYSLPIFIVAGAILLAGLVTVAQFCINIMVDMLRPKIKWNTHQEAIKQNMNVVIGMGLNLLVVAFIALCSFILIKAGLSLYINAAVVFIVCCVLAFASYKVLIDKSENAFDHIEL